MVPSLAKAKGYSAIVGINGLRVVLIDLMSGVEIKGDKAMIQVLAEFSKHNLSHVKY
ncbi:hypothetical protein [Nostoc sp. TCL240-02]|uniref:hypothetical protein n=1 Tax=Nostoc sp. TCL240-02 TaxID=2572090 RepID=UPI00349FE1EB